MHPDERLHLRALRMLDELQRIGFEQLRFCRSGEGQHVRLQIYPASQSKSDLGIQWELDQQFTLSDSVLYLWGLDRDDSARQRKWQALLAGDLAPKHLAGQWVMDFVDFAHMAYGPDHEYREWFRSIRPYLAQGYLPVTWWEDPYGTGPDYDRYVMMVTNNSETVLLPRAPANPFLAGSSD